MAIRRVWPDVLARIFSMRRATWTFVSQHAQVQEYDGRRLVLGIATVGLANTFRQGNHAELVRQALIDEIGLDVVVEGVPASDVPPPREFPLPADDGGPSRDEGGARHGDQAGDRSTPGASSGGAQPRPFDRSPSGENPPADSAPRPVPRAVTPAAGGPPVPGGSGDARPDWGASPASPGPDWASAPSSAPRPAAPAPEVSGPTGLTSGEASVQAAGVREELARVRRVAAERVSADPGAGGEAVTPVVTRDEDASPDDEDFAESGKVGREVIERVLGGRFLGDFED